MCVCVCVYYSPGPALSTFLGGSRVARLAPHKQEKEIARLNYGYLPESPHSTSVCVCVGVCVCVCECNCLNMDPSGSVTVNSSRSVY